MDAYYAAMIHRFFCRIPTCPCKTPVLITYSNNTKVPTWVEPTREGGA